MHFSVVYCTVYVIIVTRCLCVFVLLFGLFLFSDSAANLPTPCQCCRACKGELEGEEGRGREKERE